MSGPLTDWTDKKQRDFTRENIARYPDSQWPYRSILPLLDALDILDAARAAAPSPEPPSVTWHPVERKIIALLPPIGADGLCSSCDSRPSRETGSCKCLLRVDSAIRPIPGQPTDEPLPPAPVQAAGLLDRFIETAEGPVLVMDGNHVRGPATAFELDLRAALLDTNRPGLDVERLAKTLDSLGWPLRHRRMTAEWIAAEYARLQETPDDE